MFIFFFYHSYWDGLDSLVQTYIQQMNERIQELDWSSFGLATLFFLEYRPLHGKIHLLNKIILSMSYGF